MEIDKEELKDVIKEAVKDIISKENNHTLSYLMQDTMNEKVNDYMDNVHKLSAMINEFKGLVAIVRGEAKKVQTQNTKDKAKIRKLLEVLGE